MLTQARTTSATRSGRTARTRSPSTTRSEGGRLVLERNENWSAASDDYRGAYPDKWEVDFGLDLTVIDQRLMQSTGNDAFAIDYTGLQPREPDDGLH